MTGLLALLILVAVATLPLWLGSRLWEWRSRELRRCWAGVPTVDVDEPIVGVKWARIRADPQGGGATLAGLTVGGRYEVEGVASCKRGCRAPAEGCDCGFYAVRPGSEDQVFDAAEHRGPRATGVRLEVELSGSVLEYEHGYRASNQRVLRVVVPRRCVLCLPFGDDREAVALLPTVSVAKRLDAPDPSRTHPGGRDPWPVLQPVCELHRPGPDEMAPLGLTDLAGLLGTEVGWDARPAAGGTNQRRR